MNFDHFEPILIKMNDNLSKRKPFLPKDTALPFFAYGQFKSNQIAYERLAPYVEEIEYATMDGCFLAVRDAAAALLERRPTYWRRRER